jgi:O-antigen ligase
MESIGTENIPSAHNGYLDLYIDGGLVALALLFCLLLTRGLALSKGLGSSRYQRVRFAVLIMAILYNLSGSMYFRLSPIWFTTVLMFIGAVTFRTHAEHVGSETIANPMMPLPAPVLYRSRNR